MTPTAFFLILASVFMHVGWNMLVKANRPSCAFLLLLNAVTVLCLVPFLPWCKVDWTSLGADFWIPTCFSTFFQTAYTVGIFLSYRSADASVAYPLMRSLPVVLTPLVTIVLRLDTMPGPLALCGMVIVAIGCAILPQTSFRSLSSSLKSLWQLPILMTACCTTGYTITDSIASRRLTGYSTAQPLLTSAGYFFVMNLGLLVALAIIVLVQPKERKELAASCIRTPAPYIGGVLNCGAYLLVLVAMRYVKNVSYVQAFRQMGLPLCLVVSVLFLHEKLVPAKVVGLVVIIVGLLLTIL